MRPFRPGVEAEAAERSPTAATRLLTRRNVALTIRFMSSFQLGWGRWMSANVMRGGEGFADG